MSKRSQTSEPDLPAPKRSKHSLLGQCEENQDSLEQHLNEDKENEVESAQLNFTIQPPEPENSKQPQKSSIFASCNLEYKHILKLEVSAIYLFF